MFDINQSSYTLIEMFLASGPMVETNMQWKALTAFGDTRLSSTISYCLNFQQGLKRDEKPMPKLMSPKGMEGKKKRKKHHCFYKNLCTI